MPTITQKHVPQLASSVKRATLSVSECAMPSHRPKDIPISNGCVQVIQPIFENIRQLIRQCNTATPDGAQAYPSAGDGLDQVFRRIRNVIAAAVEETAEEARSRLETTGERDEFEIDELRSKEGNGGVEEGRDDGHALQCDMERKGRVDEIVRDGEVRRMADEERHLYQGEPADKQGEYEDTCNDEGIDHAEDSAEVQQRDVAEKQQQIDLDFDAQTNNDGINDEVNAEDAAVATGEETLYGETGADSLGDGQEAITDQAADEGEDKSETQGGEDNFKDAEVDRASSESYAKKEGHPKHKPPREFVEASSRLEKWLREVTVKVRGNSAYFWAVVATYERGLTECKFPRGRKAAEILAEVELKINHLDELWSTFGGEQVPSLRGGHVGSE